MRHYPNQGNVNALAALDGVLRSIALPYSDHPDHPDYREELYAGRDDA